MVHPSQDTVTFPNRRASGRSNLKRNYFTTRTGGPIDNIPASHWRKLLLALRVDTYISTGLPVYIYSLTAHVQALYSFGLIQRACFSDARQLWNRPRSPRRRVFICVEVKRLDRLQQDAFVPHPGRACGGRRVSSAWNAGDFICLLGGNGRTPHRYQLPIHSPPSSLLLLSWTQPAAIYKEQRLGLPMSEQLLNSPSQGNVAPTMNGPLETDPLLPKPVNQQQHSKWAAFRRPNPLWYAPLSKLF